MLARIGVGAIRAADGDSFDETNLNRQLLSLPKVLAQPKAQVAAMRIAEVNPEVEAEAYYAFFDETNAEKLISGCDLVMDALDNIESRRILAAWCEKLGVPLVYGAISGWVAQAAVSLPGDNFIEKLYPSGVEISDKSALSFTPALCAAMQCALATRLLCGREIKSSSLKYFDLLNMEFETIDMV
jgi:molybdopterin/thiamine biosynthesis adenylyltransferase